MPMQHNKLQLEWQGPFKVLSGIGANTYKDKVLVKVKTKIFHANLLKKYVHREEPVVVATVVYEDVDTHRQPLTHCQAARLEAKNHTWMLLLERNCHSNNRPV